MPFWEHSILQQIVMLLLFTMEQNGNGQCNNLLYILWTVFYELKGVLKNLLFLTTLLSSWTMSGILKTAFSNLFIKNIYWIQLWNFTIYLSWKKERKKCNSRKIYISSIFNIFLWQFKLQGWESRRFGRSWIRIQCYKNDLIRSKHQKLCSQNYFFSYSPFLGQNRSDPGCYSRVWSGLSWLSDLDPVLYRRSDPGQDNPDPQPLVYRAIKGDE